MTESTQSHETVGRYELITRIATGGMAEIFLARERGLAGLERLVVIKRILPHLIHQPAFVDMFLREARIIARLAHPNVVQIYELGEDKGSYFLALEYIHGCTVRELQVLSAKQKVPFPLEVALSIIASACRGAHSAHELKDKEGRNLGLVHRDISPHNLMVTAQGHVKLLDFGIAKAAEGFESTSSGSLKGKYAYMSPEQCLHLPLDRRSDVFALGIVLWELCTGRRLFQRKTEVEMLQTIIHTDAPPADTINPQVPGPIAQVISHALANERDVRIESADAFRSALAKAARESGLELDSDKIGAFVTEVGGDRLSQRNEVLEKAREQTLNSADAMRLTHVTSSLAGQSAVEGATVADRPSVSALDKIRDLPSELLPTVFDEESTDHSEDLPINQDSDPGVAPNRDTPAPEINELIATAEGARTADNDEDGNGSKNGGEKYEGSSESDEVETSPVTPDSSRRFPVAIFLLVVALGGAIALTFYLMRSEQEPVASPELAEDEAPVTYDGPPLEIGLAPTVDPEVLKSELQPLVDYLQRGLERPVILVMSESYGDLAQRVGSGEVAFGVFPPLLYVRTSREIQLAPVAVKEFDGAFNSDGYLLVRHSAKVGSLAELKGKRFCLTDPNSTTGYFLPRAYIRDHGFDVEEFIGEVHLSGDHLQVMRDLIADKCDAAATYNGAYLTANSYDIPTGQLRVLAITGHIPQDVIAAGPGASADELEQLRKLLTSFEPAEVLGQPRMGENQRITGFTAPSPTLFDELIAIVEAEEGVHRDGEEQGFREDGAPGKDGDEGGNP